MNEDIWKDSFKRGLRGAWSHPDPFQVLDDVDMELAGKRVEGMPNTIWQIMCHMLGWGWVMVRQIQGKPADKFDDDSNFFPKEDGPPSEEEWTVQRAKLWHLANEIEMMLKDFDPEKTFPDWDNITAVDALMVVVTHNSYHTAQIVMLRRMLGAWGEDVPVWSEN
ncbi:MAG: DinB family protein [Calditrichaeota bacterium]|nr:DinB family protein [Calditrichota bacterium]